MKQDRIHGTAGRGLTAAERALTDQAVAAGKVRRIAPARAPTPAPVPPRACADEPAAHPPPRNVRRLGIREALEWAFGTEAARLTFDDDKGDDGPGFGMEFLLMERAMLGQTIDVSRGRSAPADDAELIAAAVQASLPRGDALTVAALARSGATPWCGETCPRLEPQAWVCGRGGVWRGKTDDARRLAAWGPTETPFGIYTPRPARPVQRRNRLGRIVTDPVLYTPCRWSVSADRIAAKRRAYLDWWGHLLSVRTALLSTDLRWVEITRDMPPLRPWNTKC